MTDLDPARLRELVALLTRCAEFVRRYVGTVEGPYGQTYPNDAMRLLSDLQHGLAQLEPPMTHDNDDETDRELRTVEGEIARLTQEHVTATGKPALHVGRCGRLDLHQQLVTLHARVKQLQTELRRTPRGAA